MLETILLILLILDAIALGFLILIQQSKGADVGAAFGSGSASTMFGPTGGSNFLVKMTTLLAVVFFGLTFGLAYVAAERAADLRGYDFVEETDDSSSEIPDVGIIDEPGDDMPDELTSPGDALEDVDVGDSLPDIPVLEEPGSSIPEIEVGDPLPEPEN